MSARRRLRFRGLHLARSDGHPALDGHVSFDGSAARLAARLVALQLASRRRFIFFDHPGPARAQALLPRSLRARYVVQLLGVEVWRPLPRTSWRAIGGADLVLAISGHTLERGRRYLPPGPPATVVWPGLEEAAPGRPPDAALLARAGARPLLIVGRLSAEERYKGHELLFEALTHLGGAGAGARLVVVGDGSDRTRLEERARSLGVASRVLFLGQVDAATLSALYRAASCLAMPSTGEGFGLVFLEAMAAGRPWVALAEGAPAEIAAAGPGARLAAERTAESVAAAIAPLIEDRDLGERLGGAARSTFDRHFTFEAFEKRLRAAIEPLLAG